MNLENLKSFFTQLFTDLDTDDSIYILLFLAVAYLLGLLFGAMSRNRKIRRLNKLIKERDNDLITVRAENGALKEKLEISEERLQKIEYDSETTNSLLSEMEESRNSMYVELKEAKEVVGRLSTQNNAHAEEINRLNLLVAGGAGDGTSTSTQVYSDDTVSTTTNTGSTDDYSSGQTSTNDGSDDSDRLGKLEAKISSLAEENIHLRSQLIDIKGQSGVVNEDSLAAIKARLEQVELENDRLQKDLLGIKGGSTPVTTVFDNTASGDTSGGSVLGDELSSEEREAQARAALNSAFGGRLKKATAENKSNLKLIAGIGPFIENKLNDIGIYTFEQITQLDDELIGYITDAIQFFPGRIQRDDWVGQAKKLLG